MGLLDAWSQRRLSTRREGRIEFLGEQSGAVEDTLKRALTLEFAPRPAIQRAYLARVGFQPDNNPSVALCLLADAPDESIVRRIGEIFHRLFGKDAFMDVLFITADQDLDAARVCRAFYSRGT